MNRFHHIPDAAKRRILTDAGEKCNLQPYAVEKDWWVVQTLTLLFELEIGKHLVFKGGTSLSKAWGLIDRFSEDIDLAVDRCFFGFDGDLNKKRRTELRKTANQYIRATLFPELQTAFAKKGLTGVRIEPDDIKTSDQDPVIIHVYYPNVIESPGYIKPRVQVEIGCRSLREPFENRPLLSLVDETYATAVFAQQSVFVPSVVPERTLLEKIFLLHEEFKRPKEKVRVDRLSRHLYDVYQLSKTEHLNNALANKELYETIVKHRFSFTKLGGVDYNLHQPQTIHFIPGDDIMADWAADYKTMQEEMITGDSPGFDILMDHLRTLNQEINAIDWMMAIEFPKPNDDNNN